MTSKKLRLNKIFYFSIVLILSVFSFSFSQNSNSKWYTYEDSNLGYKLQIPEAPNYSDDYDTFTIHSYNDSKSSKIYSFFAIDFRNIKDKSSEELINNFMTNIANNLNGEVIKKKEIKYKDGIKYETLIQLNAEKNLRSQFIIQNSVMYSLSVEDKAELINDQSIDRFFKSLLISKAKPKASKGWIDYKNEIGAFSIKLPTEPKDIHREVPNPFNEEDDPYYLNMYSVTDLDNNDNYLFRYNDQPLGYYLEDPVSGFESIKESLVGKAELIGDEKTIYLEGYEGREYELLIQGKYHSICQIYFRGNRTYLLLKHKTNEVDKVTRDDEFFTSFKFEPYQKSELVPFKPKGTNFEILFYDKYKTSIDSTDYEALYVKNSNDYYTYNPSSGDVYQFGFSDFQDYFKISTKEEFYEETINSLMSWNDTILKQKDIKIKDIDAIEFYIQNQGTKVISRHQLWLNGKRMILMTGYLGKEEINNTLSDSIFNSFKTIKEEEEEEEEPFDVFASKSHLILDHLQSGDTLKFKKALGAFDYYVFEKNDLPMLYKALNITYKDSTTTQQIKKNIVTEFSTVNDKNTLDVVTELFNKADTNEDLKALLLSTIPDLPNSNRLETYRTLLLASPPVNAEDYNWEIFEPYRDSLDFSVANYKDLLSLMKHKNYRANIIDVFNNIAENKPEQSALITNNYDAILEYALNDLEVYLNTKDTNDEDYDYKYYSIIQSYISFFDNTDAKAEIPNKFTHLLANYEGTDWLQLQALRSRLKNNLEVNQQLIDKKLDTLYSRFEIMQTYHEINQFNKVPKKYLKSDEFAKLALYNYVGEDNALPNNIEVLGKVKKDGKEYYAIWYSFTNEDESESEKYIGIVESVNKLSQDLPFERPSSYTNWDVVEKDWKGQALKLVPDLIEYGY